MGKSLREDIRIIESQLGKPLPAGWTEAYLARRVEAPDRPSSWLSGALVFHRYFTDFF
jgi:hypothetical protein